ncbi:spore coat U domain-containing protein [Pseudomonas piscis]|uniref:Spore coat U domain-containing protein n=1 Tax=Pseudomonas piscis TaxID=2614538 RepID=A0ABY9NMA3_9PSED|nr:spore coat U domain-containing protein [Pseudomonas piscis]WMN19566.1 spore coat U domain-containing protein [Pseudomonas piscis]
MKKSIKAVAIIAMLSGASSVYATGQIQGDLDIQLAIGDGCEISNGTSSGSSTGNSFGKIDFGTQSSLGTSVIDAQSVASTGTGTIQLNCTKDVAYTISLGNGRNATSGQRNMKASGTDLVAYNLYQDAARSKAWGDTPSNQLTGKGTGAPIDLTVYGRVPKAMTPPAGVYTDSVLVTVAW